MARTGPFSTWSLQLLLGRRLRMRLRDHWASNGDLVRQRPRLSQLFTSNIASALDRSKAEVRPMTTSSHTIDAAVALAITGGKAVGTVSTGWTRARQVEHMARPIRDALYAAITTDPALRSWSADASPHHPAERGLCR